MRLNEITKWILIAAIGLSVSNHQYGITASASSLLICILFKDLRREQ